MIDIDLYLKRIGFEGQVEVSLDCLFALQKAHMHAVPFENLDVYMGRPLKLDPEDLFDKIVMRRRGGYCFELNTLYGTVLREIGFEATPLLARVWLRDPPETPSLSHILHLIDIEGMQYITDVGFGGSTTRIPLNISDENPVDDGDGILRLSPSPFEQMVQRKTPTRWENQYSFSTTPAIASDIMVGNHYTETHPNSHFRHNRFIGLFTEKGRDGLVDLDFNRRIGQEHQETRLSGADEWLAFIEDRFGLVLDLNDDEKEKLLKF